MDGVSAPSSPPGVSTAIQAGPPPLVRQPATILPPAPPIPDVQLAWLRPAQYTAVVIVALLTGLLAFQAWQYSRFGTRPTELQRGRGLSYRVDLNRASRNELLQLPGVGPNLAARIEDYRREHGGFRRVGELRQIYGVGPAMLDRLRPWVCVGSEDSEESEPDPAEPIRRQPRPPAKLSAERAAALRGPRIDINRAPAEALRRLPGIGPKLSQRIVEERQKRPFASVDELRRIPGIWQKTVERLRPYATVGPKATASALGQP